MARGFRKGDRVEWGTLPGKTGGRVPQKPTEPTETDGQRAADQLEALAGLA